MSSLEHHQHAQSMENVLPRRWRSIAKEVLEKTVKKKNRDDRLLCSWQEQSLAMPAWHSRDGADDVLSLQPAKQVSTFLNFHIRVPPRKNRNLPFPIDNFLMPASIRSGFC